MISIIRNQDIGRLGKSGNYLFVYGRRKTGKTYLIKNFLDWDKYYFVGRDNTIYEKNQTLSYETFQRELFQLLKEGKKVVVDEFQRLPADFQEKLQFLGREGKLIVISSTLWLTRELLSKKSPILGMFSEFRLNLIDERDILLNLRKYMKNKDLIEAGVYLREPWLIPLFEKLGRDFICEAFMQSKITIPALMGEIFREEERGLSRIYEAILKAISDGKRISTEIANRLYSERLIAKNDPSLIHPYLNILINLGILEKIKDFKKKRYHYFQKSPIVDLYYYLDAKYGFSERDIPDEQIKKVIDLILPRHVEQFMRNLLEKLFGLKKETLFEKDFDIDIMLTDFQKPKIVAEVKWGKIGEREIKKSLYNLNQFKAEEKIFIVKDKSSIRGLPSEIHLWDTETILTKIKQSKL